MKRGLTLGKYAPFHKGHQYVIETALKEVDELIVLIYGAPSVTNIPLSIRSGWIRTLYPQVTVREAWNGPEEVGYTDVIKKIHEDYILGTLGIRGITHFYSSEFYGDHISRALGAVNRQVDPSRKMIGISGTEIRNDPWSMRQYINPIVYRDLISSIVFLGAPSTGKTTIARTLAEEYQTCWMPEYGREYWEKHQVDRRLTREQLLEIALGHILREEKHLKEANRYCFIDTNAITTYMFSLAYHGDALPELTKLANDAYSRYDLVFLCDCDIPYDDTWDRSGDVNRLIFQKQIQDDLVKRKIPFISLRGSLEERITKVKNILVHFKKYANFYESGISGKYGNGT